jgi:hypothetical protein
MTGPELTGPATTGPATTGAATTGPATTGPDGAGEPDLTLVVLDLDGRPYLALSAAAAPAGDAPPVTAGAATPAAGHLAGA